ncbi:MAG: SDR family NAD(P)-dependent oxidoreductase [Candidatus Dormibacteraeota bacterium]|nr:SDR family NAD(P)-dependent oxidoreductase [Candidatus Dormibacteraeota bacterium]
MPLHDRIAVVYGGGGAIGGAVAPAFAEQGAHVIVAGRTPAALDLVVQPLTERGLSAEAVRLDALVEADVEGHRDRVVAEHGGTDVSFNATSAAYFLGGPPHDIPADDFEMGIAEALRAHFLTGVGAARRMAERHRGVVLRITASSCRRPLAHQGSFFVAGAAIEALCRQSAADHGPQGVRAVCIRSSGSPDAPGGDGARTTLAEQEGISGEAFPARMVDRTLLQRSPLPGEIANLAVLAASDLASSMTGGVANGACGETSD